MKFAFSGLDDILIACNLPFRKTNENIEFTDNPAYAVIPAQTVPTAHVRSGVGILCGTCSIYEYSAHHGAKRYRHDQLAGQQALRLQSQRVDRGDTAAFTLG